MHTLHNARHAEEAERQVESPHARRERRPLHTSKVTVDELRLCGSPNRIRLAPQSPGMYQWSCGQRYAWQQCARSASGEPIVESSQSITATTRGSVAWKIRLSSLKSPWTMVGAKAASCASTSDVRFSSHASSAAMLVDSSMPAFSKMARPLAYCCFQRLTCRAAYDAPGVAPAKPSARPMALQSTLWILASTSHMAW